MIKLKPPDITVEFKVFANKLFSILHLKIM